MTIGNRHKREYKSGLRKIVYLGAVREGWCVSARHVAVCCGWIAAAVTEQPRQTARLAQWLLLRRYSRLKSLEFACTGRKCPAVPYSGTPPELCRLDDLERIQ